MSRLVRELAESVRIAFQQIWAHKLRSALTALGVIIGIAAVTLMGTAINGVNTGFNASLAMLGEDVLYIQRWPWGGASDWWNFVDRPPINPDNATQINDIIANTPHSLLDFAVPMVSQRTGMKFGPNTVNAPINGTSEGYIRMMTADVAEGRFFDQTEEMTQRRVCVIGATVADTLFPNGGAVGSSVLIHGHPFDVVGVLAKQGDFLGFRSSDTQVYIPIGIYHRYFQVRAWNAAIQVKIKDVKRIEDARDELIGAMRRVRGQLPGERDSFSINAEESLKQQLSSITGVIALAGLFVTGLALFVGAIGIMNITFVSVKERTKEIGTRKALGAKRRTILLQFLIESVAICLVGGVFGLASTGGLALLLGKLLPHIPLLFSPVLVVVSLTLAVTTGVIAGFAPALSASRLDPVVALRYE